VDVSTDPAAEDFLDAFDVLVQAVRRARGAPVQTADRSLTMSQYALLRGLAERTEARVYELATEASITAPTASRILDTLERREVVRRTRASDDRRAVTVTLTPSGRDQLSSQHEWMRGRTRAFYTQLPPDEREFAADLLARVATLIDELAAGPDA
jgi:DNA-binding MarR family transcriptional regulator